MIPIFEQGDGRGIGLGLESFEARFKDICKEHEREGRAKAFAFVFYDFTDAAIRKILKDKGVFVQLDRLSGKDLSIFYMHSGTRRAITEFNERFLTKIGISESVSLPCVVFFRLSENAVRDISIVKLESPNEIHGFYELHSIVKEYLGKSHGSVKASALKWLKGKTDQIGTDLFVATLFKFLEHIF